MIDDRHKRHELRQKNVIRLVYSGDTLPADLDVDVPPVPAWMQPVPRQSRDCTPFIQHNSTGNPMREFISIYRLYRRSHGVMYSLRMARDIALRGFPF